ncbi:MAG: AAA family ATPase [Pseudomonadota bacterium]
MRLRRLDLTRYGHFTDAVLDFGPRPDEGPDLHIVFGPNEAGKSTIYNAWLDLLFGIGLQTDYRFLHPRAVMRVGAEIEIAGQSMPLARITRQKDNLLGAEDHPADPGVLTAALAGLGREEVRAMFSLDDDTIETGGEAILESRGELGALLFSAAAGYPEFVRALEAVEGRAAAFHRPGGRATELRRLRSEIAALEKERREADVDTASGARLADALEAAAKAADEARVEHERLVAEVTRLEAMAAAFPLRDALVSVRTALEALPSGVPVPEGWEAEIQSLALTRAARVEERRGAMEEAERLGDALAAEPLDAEALELAPALEAVEVSRAETAVEDLPRRIEEHDGLQTALAALDARLGLSGEGATKALPDEAGLLGLEARLAQHERTAAALRSAGDELEKAQTALREAEAAATHHARPPEAASALGPLLRRLRVDALLEGQATAAAGLREAEAALAPAVEALTPWEGAANDLPGLAVPAAAEVETLRRRLREHEQDRREIRSRQDTAEADRARLAARLAALEAGGDPVSDARAAALRSDRDAAWETHRAQLDDASADAFAAAMADDDALRDRRVVESGRLAEIRTTERALAEAEAARRVEGERSARLMEAWDAEAAARAPVLSALGLPSDMPPDAFATWCERAARAVDLARVAVAKAQALEAAAAACQQASEALTTALAACEVPVPAGADLGMLADLAAGTAEKSLERAARSEAAEKALAARRHDHVARQGAMARAVAAATEAEAAWAELATGPLSGLSPETAGPLLPLLRKRLDLAAKAGELSDRIAKLERDRDRFAAAMATLLEDAVSDPLKAHRALTYRVAEARAAHERRQTIEAERGRAFARAEGAARGLVTIDARLAEMAALADLASPPETRVEALTQWVADSTRRAALETQRADREAALAAALGAPDAATAEARLAEETPGAVAAQLAALEPEREAAAKALEQALEAKGEARRAYAEIGADDRAVRLGETRAALLADLADGAEEAIRLHLGALAARRALARYRDRHRSEMLAHTAEAFSVITGGSFPRLATQPDGAVERLVAQRKGGGSIGVDAMSKGTRFQLYLALRIAGHRRFAAVADPLPFFADDILETFDDGRAAAALRLMGEIGRRGQAICLTHHAHLCDIAREVYGEAVRIHRVPERA